MSPPSAFQVAHPTPTLTLTLTLTLTPTLSPTPTLTPTLIPTLGALLHALLSRSLHLRLLLTTSAPLPTHLDLPAKVITYP